MTDERGEQLVRRIEAGPEAVHAYRAGDWLEELAPRSQLMGMQIVRERLTDRHRLDHLDARLAEHSERHREYFQGWSATPALRARPRPRQLIATLPSGVADGDGDGAMG